MQWYHIQQQSANYVHGGTPSSNRDHGSGKDTPGPFQRRSSNPSKHLTLALRTAYGEAGFEIPSGILLAKNTNVLG